MKNHSVVSALLAQNNSILVTACSPVRNTIPKDLSTLFD